MMDVHHKGRAVVSSGNREEMERDVQAMHGYGLWATLSRTADPTSLGRTTGLMAGFFKPAGNRRRARSLLDEVEISILRTLVVQTAGADRARCRAGRRRRRPARPALRRRPHRAARRPRPRPAVPRRLPRPGTRTGRRIPGSRPRSSAATPRPTCGPASARRPRGRCTPSTPSTPTAAAAPGSPHPRAGPRWLGSLNDLRLTIGTPSRSTRTGQRVVPADDDDPRKPLMMAYLWLGGLQETLIETHHP